LVKIIATRKGPGSKPGPFFFRQRPRKVIPSHGVSNNLLGRRKTEAISDQQSAICNIVFQISLSTADRRVLFSAVLVTARAGRARLIDLSFEWRGDTNVKKSLMLIALGLTACVLGAGLFLAQDPVVGSKDPESLFTSKDPKLNANKQAAMHIMRDLLEAGHW